MIKIFDGDVGLSNEECKRIFETFPDVLKEKIKKKRDEKTKKMCIAEYFFLQKLLKIESLNGLQISPNGKPYIDEEKFFNISNSGDKFCIATADKPIGVDIQKMIRFDQRLAKKICNAEELGLLDKAVDKDLEITKIWTKKEAFIKCKGETIGQDLKALLRDTKGFKFRFLRKDNFVVCECKKTL